MLSLSFNILAIMFIMLGGDFSCFIRILVYILLLYCVTCQWPVSALCYNVCNFTVHSNNEAGRHVSCVFGEQTSSDHNQAARSSLYLHTVYIQP